MFSLSSAAAAEARAMIGRDKAAVRLSVFERFALAPGR